MTPAEAQYVEELNDVIRRLRYGVSLRGAVAEGEVTRIVVISGHESVLLADILEAAKNVLVGSSP